MWDPPPIELRGRLSAPGSIVTEWDRFAILPGRTRAGRSEACVTRQGFLLDHIAYRRGRERDVYPTTLVLKTFVQTSLFSQEVPFLPSHTAIPALFIRTATYEHGCINSYAL